MFGNVHKKLIKAVDKNDSWKVEECLKKGADINTRDNFRDNATPLMIAASSGHQEIVHLLCSKGADLNLTSNHGFTALMSAVLKGHYDVVSTLIMFNADETCRNSFGQNAYDLAKLSNATDIMSLLVEY